MINWENSYSLFAWCDGRRMPNPLQVGRRGCILNRLVEEGL